MSDAIMKARQLIDGASFGPEALKAIGQAFDKAWLEIAGNFGDDIEKSTIQACHRTSVGRQRRQPSRGSVETSRAPAHGAELPTTQLTAPTAYRRDP